MKGAREREMAMAGRAIFSSWSIRRKLMLLVLVVFLPAVGIIVVSGIDRRDREISVAENSIVQLVQSLAAQQEQIAIGTREMLSTLAQLPAVQTRDSRRCNALFRDLANHHPFYSVIGAETPQGTLFASSAPLDAGHVNLLDRKHIRDALRYQDFSVGEFQVGKVTKVPSINYSYPVFDAKKQLVAIVSAGFKLDEYARFIAEANLPDNSVVIIADWRGIRLVSLLEGKAAAQGEAIPAAWLKQMSGKKNLGFFQGRGADGVFRIYAFKRLRIRKDSPPYLFMIVGADRDSILHTANINMLTDLLVLGLAAVMALAVAWFFSEMVLISPIDRLVAATRRIGRGEPGARTRLSYRADELGILAKSFDDMALMLETKDAEQKKTENSLRESEKRLAADLEGRIRLQKIANLFVREGSLGPVLGEIVEAAMAISGADFGDIQLLDPRSSKLRSAACRGFRHWWVEFWKTTAAGRGTCGAALDQVQRVIVEDVTQSPIFTGTPELEMQLKAGVRAVQSTPLLSWSGKLLGMFSTHYKTPGRPDDQALRLLDLLARMAADIIERAHGEEALRRSEKGLRFLSSKLLTAQEEERKRLSGELHDSLGSSLAALKMVLENARCQLDQNQMPSDWLDTPIAWTQHAIEEARSLMTNLRPPVLDEEGVVAAIEKFLGQYRISYPGIRVRTQIDIEEDDIAPSLKIVIFRTAQEAFHNIAKHSQTDQASFSLLQRNGAIELVIADRGKGFDIEAVFAKAVEKQGLGLRSMKERVELAGGSFRIQAVKGTGTTLTALWPVFPSPENQV